MNNQNQSIESILGLAIRGFLYCTLVWLTSLVIWQDAPQINEHGWTEKTQSAFLLLSIMFYLWASIKFPKSLPATTILIGGTLLCVIREFDYHFEKYDKIFGPTWPLLMGFYFLLFLGLVLVQRKALKEALLDFINLHSFGILLSGFFMVYVFSRVIGYKSFWISVMGDKYMPFVRRFVEEGAELFGYTLFFIASIEFFLICRKRSLQ